MRKKTVVTPKVIEILKVYMVEEVCVSEILVNGNRFQPAEKYSMDQHPSEEKKRCFSRLFRETVIRFQNEFCEWQSGFPVNISRVKAIVYPLLEWEKTNSLKFLQSVSFSYESFFEHTIGITMLSAFIGKTFGYDKEDLQQLILAACLCDCGMALAAPNELKGLSTSLHNKSLNHPLYSYKLIKDNCLLTDEAKMAIVQHHERLDGSGYPFGSLFKKIHPYAKIIAISCELIKKISVIKSFPSEQQYFVWLLEEIFKESAGKLDGDFIRELQMKIKYSAR